MEVLVTSRPTFPEVERRLKNLGEKLHRKGLRSGLVAAASPMKQRMKMLAPAQPGGGALRRSIGHRNVAKRDLSGLGLRPDDYAIYVGVTRKVSDPKYQKSPGKKIDQAFKARWIEHGTKPHRIPRESKRNGSPVAIDGKVFHHVQHPGFPARPFIKPAFESVESKVDDLFLRGIQKYLDKF